MSNSTLFRNSTLNNGGGIWNAGTLNVLNSTFSENSATVSGGGVYVFTGGSTTLKNTILANSVGGDCVGSLSGTNKHNLIEDSGVTACGLVNNSNGNKIGLDPKLGTWIANFYFTLQNDSPAIDAGDNATCAAAPVSNQSKNGVTRPKDSDGNGSVICDIGAYEGPQTVFRLFLPLIRR
ncbi:MAG: hypothetical protein NZ840_13240 [Anaerolineales bacterium]|nr:hypothetical protein [Anaerolineales bacterium]MDW8162999.1 choice-of-anchor Q domain-containing protein [Anaerolineales bacterium]